MNEQILGAAILILSPKTSSEQRQIASNNLELWLSSPSFSSSKTTNYTSLLHALFFTDVVERGINSNSNNSDVTSTGVKLLFLSMLHNQCQRMSTNTTNTNNNVEEEIALRNLLEKVYACLNICINGDTALLSQLCSVTAAVAVRKGGIKELILHATTASITSMIGYRLLISLAQEIEIHFSFDKKEIQVLDIKIALLQKVYNGIIVGDALALQVLSKWVPLLSITLSQLVEYNDSTNNAQSPSTITNQYQQHHESNVLFLLIRILSSNNNSISEQMIIHTANVLSESILISDDSGTSSRTQSISLLLESIPTLGFIVYPFTISHKDSDDAAHALSNLACNLAIEEVDFISLCPNVGCNKLIELLFHIQMHTHGSVSMPVLDVWLAFQDVPVRERHESMTYPLFSRLLDILVKRISYPLHFRSWDDHDDDFDIDSSDFEQFRKLACDVLISMYFLLRSNFLNQLYQTVLTSSSTSTTNLPQWNVLESSLFCLTSISTEVHSRLKNSIQVRSVIEDCTSTSIVLLSILEICCFSESQQQHNNHINSLLKQHPLLLLSLVTFLGNYARLWNICNDIDSNSILQMLNFLQKTSFDHVTNPQLIDSSSKAIKSIFINCASKIIVLHLETSILPILVHFMQHVVSTITTSVTNSAAGNITSNHSNTDSVLNITEGITRLLVKYPNDTKLHQAMVSVTAPLLQKSYEALNYIQTGKATTETEIACQLLELYLRVIEVVIKFCEVPSSNDDNQKHPLADLFTTSLWPFLSSAIPICRQNHTLFGQILSVSGQILSSIPQLISPYISELITFVVQSYEEMFYPSALDFIATTLESSCVQGSSSSSSSEHHFSLLLSHILKCTCYYVTTQKHPTDCPQLIFSFFDLCKRFLVFSPNVLYHCSDLSTLFSFAAACLTECHGQIESTRATLNFLNQIMMMSSPTHNPHGTRGNLSSGTSNNDASTVMEPLVLNDGQTITNFCITGLLAGNMPQILHPSLADCLVSLLSFIVIHCDANNINNNSNHPVTSSAAIETLHSWMSSSLKAIKTIDADYAFLFEKILLTMMKEKRTCQQQGNMSNKKTSRQSMKMLLMDFSKICKGEMSHDSLLSYSLNGDA